MTNSDALQLEPGVLVCCDSPGRRFHLNVVVVDNIESYGDGEEVFVWGHLRTSSDSQQDIFVFKPDEIEVLQ